MVNESYKLVSTGNSLDGHFKSVIVIVIVSSCEVARRSPDAQLLHVLCYLLSVQRDVELDLPIGGGHLLVIHQNQNLDLLEMTKLFLIENSTVSLGSLKLCLVQTGRQIRNKEIRYEDKSFGSVSCPT